MEDNKNDKLFDADMKILTEINDPLLPVQDEEDNINQRNIHTSQIRLKQRKIPLPENQELLVQLLSLDFTIFYATICIYLSKADTVEEVFQYIDSHPDLIDHPFEPSNNPDVCIECFNNKIDHRFFNDSSEEDVYYIKEEDQEEEEEEEEEDEDAEIQEIDQTIRISQNKDRSFNIIESQQMQECTICYEDIPLRDIIKFNGIKHDICKKCFQLFLEESINIGKVLELCCPHCSERLSYKFIQSILSATTFSKFRQYLLSQLITLDPLMRWCPNVKCGQPIQLRTKFKRKEMCDKCQNYLCTECNREFHSGSCSSYFQKEIKKWKDHSDIQRCKICKTVIAKISGCNHMTCKVCLYEWCWLCGGSYDSLHFNPFYPFGCPSMQYSDTRGCKYYLLRLLYSILYILAIPLAMVIGMPITLCIYGEKKFYPSCCERFWIYPLGILIGFILQPLADAVLIIGIIPFFIIMMAIKWKKNREMKQRSLKNLSENRALIGLGISRSDL